jgi:hypothetical protein
MDGKGNKEELGERGRTIEDRDINSNDRRAHRKQKGK